MQICHWHETGDSRHSETLGLCCPQILEEHAELTFHLQQQRLIELIRGGDADAALAFAQDILAPLGEEHPAFLAELGAAPHSSVAWCHACPTCLGSTSSP